MTGREKESAAHGAVTFARRALRNAEALQDELADSNVDHAQLIRYTREARHWAREIELKLQPLASELQLLVERDK
jgi:hypothetical protein